MWNLTEFVPTSMTANRFAPSPTSALSPRAMFTFGLAPRPSSRTAAITPAASSDSTAIVRRDALPGANLGDLRHAAADRVVVAPLVDLDRKQAGASAPRAPRSSWSSVYSLRRDRRALDAERLEHRGDVVAAEREGRLEDRLPLLEPVVVHALEQLDVQLRVADLDRGVARSREQVDLVALLDLLRLESGEAIVGVAEDSPKVRHSQRGITDVSFASPGEVLERLARLRLLLAREVDRRAS